MLFFVDFRVNPKDLSLDQLWDEWEKEAEAALGAMEAGKVVALYISLRAAARHRGL